MKYLIVFTTALLSTMKVSFQSSFAKKGVRTGADSVFFNMLIFTAAALLFCPYLFGAPLPALRRLQRDLSAHLYARTLGG